ncbi:MAG: ParA family protein [Thainema sp.]
MRYAVWNNKGGVGKTFLSFVLSTEFSHAFPSRNVILVDMCPQANVSEIILGGNGSGGAEKLNQLIEDRKTVGGYFDERINSPQKPTETETNYLLKVQDYNSNVPPNLWLLAGDPSLEIQAQVISQISAQTLPVESWKNVHNWLKDLVLSCSDKLGEDVTVFIDCNPSFSAYTELALAAAERIIVPCTSDDSSARAINNIGALIYGVGVDSAYSTVNFSGKAKVFDMPLPELHCVVLNRSTQYNQKASKAFAAMFKAIQERVNDLGEKETFVASGEEVSFQEIPDSHSVTIVCSHLGKPLYSITPGKYEVYDTNPQVNSEPIDRYKEAVAALLSKI